MIGSDEFLAIVRDVDARWAETDDGTIASDETMLRGYGIETDVLLRSAIDDVIEALNGLKQLALSDRPKALQREMLTIAVLYFVIGAEIGGRTSA